MERLEQYLDKKYILQKGKLLYYNNTHFNNDTITDKIAESAIKKFPALVNAFISDKERKILETTVKGKGLIGEAEKAAKDEKLEKRIGLLIEAGEFEEAKKQTEDLAVDETRDNFIAEIEKEEKAIEDKIAAEEKAKILAEAKTKAEAEKAKAEAKANKP